MKTFLRYLFNRCLDCGGPRTSFDVGVRVVSICIPCREKAIETIERKVPSCTT